MLSGRHIHRPKNIIRSSVRCFHTINICLPTRIVNFRENHCSSCLRINLIFQVIRFVRSQFDCTQCICFSRRFYLRTEFLSTTAVLPDLSDAKHLSLHWHYPHTAPRLQTKHCPAYKDSVSGQSFHLAAENKVTGIQHIQHRKPDGATFCISPPASETALNTPFISVLICSSIIS